MASDDLGFRGDVRDLSCLQRRFGFSSSGAIGAVLRALRRGRCFATPGTRPPHVTVKPFMLWSAPFALCLLITAWAAVLRSYHLGELPAWRDETVVYWLGQESLGRLLSRSLALTGTHPPLFYIIHYFWNHLLAVLGIAPSAVTIRLPSVAIGTLTVPLFFVIFRRSFGERVALIGAAFLATSPAHLAFSRTAKSEVLVVFLLVATLGFACQLLDRMVAYCENESNAYGLRHDRRFLVLAGGYVASAILLVHTHSLGFFGLFLPSVLYLVHLAGRKVPSSTVWIWSAINLTIVVAFLPWFVLLLEIAKANTGYYWLTPIDAHETLSRVLLMLIDAPQPPGGQVSPYIMLGGIMVTETPLVIGVSQVFQGGLRRYGILAGFLVVPVLLFALSQFKPVFWPYMLTTFALPFMALLVGFALEMPFLGRNAHAGVVLAFLVLLVPIELEAYGGVPEPWDEVARYLSQHVTDGDPVLFWPPFGEWSTRFYWQADIRQWRTISLGPNVDFQPLRTVPSIPVAQIGGFVRGAHHVWLVTEESTTPDPNALPHVRKILASQLPAMTRHNFASDVEIYDFSAAPLAGNRR